MKVIGGRRKSAPGVLIVGVAAISLVTAGTANAAVVGTSDAVAFATALSAVSPVGGSFAVSYNCDPDANPATEDPCPTAVSDVPLAGFPTNGPTYSILTSGNAALADDARAARYLLPLPVVGAGIAVYHLLVENGVVKQTQACLISAPGGCATKWINEFGFMTIPTLALTGFALAFAFLVLAAFEREAVPVQSPAVS